MINLIGKLPNAHKFMAEPGLHWHDYTKQARPGRKLGHCTLIESTAQRRDARTRKLLARLGADLLVTP